MEKFRSAVSAAAPAGTRKPARRKLSATRHACALDSDVQEAEHAAQFVSLGITAGTAVAASMPATAVPAQDAAKASLPEGVDVGLQLDCSDAHMGEADALEMSAAAAVMMQSAGDIKESVARPSDKNAPTASPSKQEQGVLQPN